MPKLVRMLKQAPLPWVRVLLEDLPFVIPSEVSEYGV